MGRNAGSKVWHTHTYDGTNYISTWYCQQHAKWDQYLDASPSGPETWINHIAVTAGNHGADPP